MLLGKTAHLKLEALMLNLANWPGESVKNSVGTNRSK